MGHELLLTGGLGGPVGAGPVPVPTCACVRTTSSGARALSCCRTADGQTRRSQAGGCEFAGRHLAPVEPSTASELRESGVSDHFGGALAGLGVASGPPVGRDRSFAEVIELVADRAAVFV